MLKKFSLIAITAVMTMSLVGCKPKKTQDNVVKSNKAEITAYVQKGSNIDLRYSEDPQVAINHIDGKGPFSKEDVKKIASNIDNNVKVLIISAEQKGLLPVFEEVRKKIPGIITVAADMEEMHNKELYKVLKDENLNVAFDLKTNRNGRVSAIMAKKMGAKNFVYLYSKGENPEYLMDIKDAKNYCLVNKMEFSALEVSPKDLEEKLSGYNPEYTAIFPGNESLTESSLNVALKKKMILPNLNSDNDGSYLKKALNITDKNLDTREKFDAFVTKKLKTMGMQGRIAGISEGRQFVPTELSIDIAEYMYEKRYMLEECFRDFTTKEIGNQKLDLTIFLEQDGVSYGYARKISLSPRVY